ncbi:family 43 glycosylhydrolase [Georgenia alba]|uniref:Family 43 glycosylhydrolase n=1 Tax=Georgenia alba TaxID=2233858 RepID=A0ABW2QFK6_9MICO
MMVPHRPLPRRVRRSLAPLLAVLLLLAATPAGAAPGDPETRVTYENPVTDGFSDTYADPAVIQGKDGWWYVYATADPLVSGGDFGLMHMARTRDWVDWEYLGTIFDESDKPGYAAQDALLWAPDIRYVDGRYVLYFTVTDTVLNDGPDTAIGVATSPRPEGPFTVAPEPIVEPRPREEGEGFVGTIDPAGFTDADGQNYLYFGAYDGGFWGAEVSDDGLSVTGEHTRLTVGDRYEGGYVVRHDDWYYFMGSSANCCAGPTTGYTVSSGRSRSPLGPFVDDTGQSLLDPYVGGTNVIHQNGNEFIGVGHHAVATDVTGRDWMVYHGIDRGRPWLEEPFGVNRRPTLIDPIDWIDGWPRVRAGAGPSAGPQVPPVTESALGIVSDDPAAGGTRGLVAGPADPLGGETARLHGSARTAARAPEGRVRVRLDVTRLDRPVSVTLGARRDSVVATVDPRAGTLAVATTSGRATEVVTDRYAVAPAWQTLVLEVDGPEVLAQVSESDLSDPAAEVRVTRGGLDLPSAPVRLRGGGAVLDNLTVAEPAVEATETVPVPEPGAEILTEDFDSTDLEGWSWVRQNADARVSGGALSWPVEEGELVGPENPAGVLLRDAPSDEDWMVETRLELDLDVREEQNFQQAGLVVYRDDDDFARLSKVAIGGTRQVEFGRERPEADDLSYGGSIVGRPGRDQTWLRIAHHLNADGEHLYRAATSHDGESWTWGAVWTFEPGEAPRIGLVSQGGARPEVTARFAYLRFHETTWPSSEVPRS